MNSDLALKYNNLKSYLKKLNKVAVAYSSGVDSTFLLKVAKEVLGANAVAITVESECFPLKENNEADGFCKENGIKHIKVEFSELEIDGFRENPKERCYICKKALFKRMLEVTEESKIPYLIEGSNKDDESDYRPGMKALAETEVLSPLRECELTKKEIRELSRELQLYTWNKPSFACLATRFPYGEEITYEKLKIVEKSEEFLGELGFCQMRVRMHGDVARIEVPEEDIETILQKNNRHLIVNKLKEIGFKYVALDLQGYRSGSMNEIL